MPINSPLQLCIDPNHISSRCTCSSNAAGFNWEAPSTGESLVSHVLQQDVRQLPWEPPGKTVQKSLNKTTTIKPLHRFQRINTGSVKWIMYLYDFTFAKNWNSTCLFPCILAYPEPFTQSGFHPDLPHILASAEKWDNLPLLHGGVQTVSFMGELRDSQSLQQIRGELIAIYSEELRKHK